MKVARGRRNVAEGGGREGKVVYPHRLHFCSLT